MGPTSELERPPYYNALDPVVQDWYVAVVGELADRYQNFPAFEGVDLRIMAWSNAALNNLVSLDWGYDALTVARFAAESGFSLPVELTSSGKTIASWLRSVTILLCKIIAKPGSIGDVEKCMIYS